jgi:DnaJ-domain-containing protein 1
MAEKLHTPIFERLKAGTGKRPEPPERLCEWPDCDYAGEHRAPRSRDDMKSYRWFCLEHAREYNKNWNYFAGMTDAEVEADRRADTVWRRPSWPLGDGVPTAEHARAFWRGEYADPFGFFGEGGEAHGAGPEPANGGIGTDVRKALELFELSAPVTVVQVKARYKELAKRYHPDAAQGQGKDKGDDALFKDINQAYRVILGFLAE